MRPPEPESDKAPRATQAGSLRLGAGFLMGGRAVTALCGLIQLPVVYRGLSLDDFGLWVALVGLLWTCSSLDGGLGFALQNRLSSALARGQGPEASVTLRTGLLLTLGLSCLVFLCLLILSLSVDWMSWFHLDGALRTKPSVGSLVLLAMAAAMTLPSTLAARVATAVQKTWISGLWTMVSSSLMLAVVLLIPPSLGGYLAASCLPLLLPGVLTFIHLWLQETWLRTPSGQHFAWKGLTRESLLFFSPQLGAAFAGAFLPALVAAHAGLQAAAVYGILHRLYSLAQQMLSLALQPVWPAYTHAFTLGQHAQLRALLKKSSLLCGLGFMLPMALGTVLVPTVLRLWLGPSAPVVDATLLWFVCLWNLLMLAGQPPSILLNGTGRLWGVAFTSWLWMLLAWLLASPLSASLGGAGVILALTLAYGAAYLPVVWTQALGILRKPTGNAAEPKKEEL